MSFQKVMKDGKLHFEVDIEGHSGKEVLTFAKADRTRFSSRLIDAVLQELAQIERELSKSGQDIVIEGRISFTKGLYTKVWTDGP